MTETDLPLIVEPSVLASRLQQENVLLIDVSQAQTYVQMHIPDAVFLEYDWIVHREQPRMGLLPDQAQLDNVLSAYGLTPQTHVVAYDDEGGGRACRLLWTLDCVGHHRYSLLNGGIHAWTNEHLDISSHITFPSAGSYQATFNENPIADRQFILDHLNQPDTVILDTRSAQEFAGTKVLAARGGHIPGAINMDWTEAMDKTRNLRLKSEQQLRAMLESKGITPDKTVVCHCQTHHRSAHTYIMLKSLGYDKLKGYPGSWSDWGNDLSTPVET